MRGWKNSCPARMSTDDRLLVRTRACIVRGLSPSFQKALSRTQDAHTIDMEMAQKQHANYVRQIRAACKEVIELEGDPAYPDCCFIEDNAVVIGRRAALTLSGATSRQGEREVVGRALSALGTSLTVMNEPARCDGGDVLFTGYEIFVGISSRTNREAVQCLEEAFPSWTVHPVVLPSENALHLKCAVSTTFAGHLVIADNELGRHIVQKITELSVFSYEIVWVPDEVASNVVVVNSRMLIQKGFPSSEEALHDAFGDLFEIVSVEMSELIKADGALTCSLLLVHEEDDFPGASLQEGAHFENAKQDTTASTAAYRRSSLLD